MFYVCEMMTWSCFSAFVGLGVILLLFPLPGYVTKLIQDVQAVRLKATDARVQTVTESKCLA